MKQILVIVASTRPGRLGKPVGDWVIAQAKQQSGISVKVADLAEINLPFLNESLPAAAGKYEHEHTKNWAETVGATDGFIIVTPEYNHGYPATLKNALDYLYAEWTNKPVALVGYSAVASSGIRAVEQLLPVLHHLGLHTLSNKVLLPSAQQDVHDGVFSPSEATVLAMTHTLEALHAAVVR